MLSNTNRTEITLESRLDSVTVAESICVRVAAAAGFDEDDCYRISVAVREGVINAFRWGNEEQTDKKIFMSLHVDDGKLIVRIADQGSGFDIADVPDPLADANLLRTSGRGILMMRAFMDEWAVKRSNEGGAEVTMAKRVPRNGNPSSGHR